MEMKDIHRRLGEACGMLEAGAPTRKVLEKTLELIGALADRLDAIDDMVKETNDYVARMDDDLGRLEDMHDEEFGDMPFPDEDEPEDGGPDDEPDDEPDEDGDRSGRTLDFKPPKKRR